MEIRNVAAVVTGGASGLGAATAELLANRGARVTIFDMNEAAGQTHAEKIGGRFAKVNVTDEANVAEALAASSVCQGERHR